jgi:PKD repeat protein
MDWLLDAVSVEVSSTSGRSKRVTLTASPTSSVGATFTQYRWDFGDGSRFVTTTGPTVTHQFRSRRNYEVRVEVTDSLGHRAIGSGVVELRRGGDGDDDDDD